MLIAMKSCPVYPLSRILTEIVLPQSILTKILIPICSSLPEFLTSERNYAIPEADLHIFRGIAGKIIPAIATTTALVTGAICLEIFKIIQKFPSEKLYNSFNNLALPLFSTLETTSPKVNEYVCGKTFKWTARDRVDIQHPNMTLKELIDYIHG